MSISVEMMGQRIREARKAKMVTAEQLAEQIGIAVESLGHIECGNRKPSLQTLYNISEALDVSLDYLTGRTMSPATRMIHQCASNEQLNEKQIAALQKIAKELIPVVKEYV